MSLWNRAALSLADSLVKPEPWEVSSIPIKLHDRSVSPPLAVNFDIASSIVKPHRNGKPFFKPLSFIPPGSLFLPTNIFKPSYESFKDEKKTVTSYLQRACVPAGFKLVSGNKVNLSSRFAKYTYTCSQCRFKQKSRISPENRQKERKHTRPDPTLGDVKCPFRLSISYDKTQKQWFFPPVIDGNTQHLGHFQLDPSHVPVPAKCLTPKELDQVISQLQLNFPPSKIQALLEMTTKMYLSRNQIKSIRRAMLRSNCLSEGSPAGRLLQRLNEDPTVSFVAHTAHIGQANRVTIRSHSGVDLATLVDPQSAAHQHSTGNDKNLTKKQKYAKSILNALRIPSSDNLLLCVAWTTSIQKKWFNKFPFTLSLGVTHNTNSEKRPLARGTVKTGNKNTVPIVSCYMPSECKWVWDWLLGHAFPQLFGEELLSKVELVLTGEDSKCTSQVDAQILQGYWKGAKRRLCGFHKIDRHFIVIFFTLFFTLAAALLFAIVASLLNGSHFLIIIVPAAAVGVNRAV